VLKKDKAVQSSFIVSEVVGEVDITYIQSLLESKCGAETITVDALCMFVPGVQIGIRLVGLFSYKLFKIAGSLPSSYHKRPQAIRVNFPEPPLNARRVQQIVDNG
jgi:hypothetical protein